MHFDYTLFLPCGKGRGKSQWTHLFQVNKWVDLKVCGQTHKMSWHDVILKLLTGFPACCRIPLKRRGVINTDLLLSTQPTRGALTFSDLASRDFRLFVTFFSSSSRSQALLQRGRHTHTHTVGSLRAKAAAVHSYQCIFSTLTILQSQLSPQFSPDLPPGSPAYGQPEFIVKKKKEREKNFKIDA